MTIYIALHCVCSVIILLFVIYFCAFFHLIIDDYKQHFIAPQIPRLQ